MTTALEQLFDAVVARFAEDTPSPAVPVPNRFGWREWAQHKTTTGRIVWAPGDESGSLGEVGAGKYPGGNPRRLLTIGELFTVSISGSAPATPENERAQYSATRALADAWLRAVYLAAAGRFSIVSSGWDMSKKERRFGAAIHIVATIDSFVLDEEHPVVAPTTAHGARGESAVTFGSSDPGTTENLDTGVAIPTVHVATTGPITRSGSQTIDSVLAGLGAVVLVKDDPNPAANGPYVVAAGTWPRAPQWDSSAEITSGLFFRVTNGAVNGGAGFTLTTPDPIVLGVTPLTFERTSP